MTPFEYEPGLMEEAVFREMVRREASDRAADYREYRGEIDRVYDRTADDPPEARDEALRRLHEALFAELDFPAVVGDLVREHAYFGGRLDRISVLAAENRKAEGAELFVREDEEDPEALVRTLVLRIYPESYLDLSRLREFLARELCHVADMLNPAFGYEPNLGTSVHTKAQEGLVRDRYSVLWKIAIERRILRPAEADIPTRLRRLAERAFAGLRAEDLERRLQKAWSGKKVTHDMLIALAGAPDPAADPDTPQPGAPCPNCDFPTHSWVRTESGPSCLQCAEMLACRTHESPHPVGENPQRR